MIRRVILSGVEGRSALASGAEKLAKAVGSTFGPHGQNWYLDKKNTVTNDGVSIAREFQLPDEVENRGAAAIREAATKTVEEVGDGTTSAIMLSWAIYEKLSALLPKKGVVGTKTAAELIRQLEKERVEVTNKLVSMATPIETEQDLIHSATVATEDPELGKLIGSGQWQVGKGGYLLAEDSNDRTSSMEIVKGVRIDNGAGTSMVFNNLEKQMLELKDVPVLLTSFTIKDFGSLERPFNEFLKSGKNEVVVIARAWTEAAINLCQQNFAKGFKIYPLNAPYMDMQQKFLDLAAVTGAKFYDSESSDIRDVTPDGFGFATKIVANRYNAIITGKDDEDTAKRVSTRVGELAMQQSGSESEFEKKNLAERMAQLTNGFGLIKVGSASDMEKRRLLDKAEDAVNAVRAAYQEGTVPGAGIAFRDVATALPDTYILKRPLTCLYDQIISSAPTDFTIDPWVRDPVKVLRVALERACAAAGAFASAGGVITVAFPKQLEELMRPVQNASQQEE